MDQVTISRKEYERLLNIENRAIRLYDALVEKRDNDQPMSEIVRALREFKQAINKLPKHHLKLCKETNNGRTEEIQE